MNTSILRLGSFHRLSLLHSDDAGYFQLRFLPGRPNKNGTAMALLERVIQPKHYGGLVVARLRRVRAQLISCSNKSIEKKKVENN